MGIIRAKQYKEPDGYFIRNVVLVVVVWVKLLVVEVGGGVVVVSVVFVIVIGKVTVCVTETVEVVNVVTEVDEIVDVGLCVAVVVVVVGTQILPDITSGFVFRRGRSRGSTLLRKQIRAKPFTLVALPHVHAPQRASRKHSVRQAPALWIGPSLRRAICVK